MTFSVSTLCQMHRVPLLPVGCSMEVDLALDISLLQGGCQLPCREGIFIMVAVTAVRPQTTI